MAQEELQSLLLNIIDEYEAIENYQEMLQIAIEQMDCSDCRTLNRVKLLLSSYLSNVEPHFEKIQHHIKRRDKLNNVT